MNTGVKLEISLVQHETVWFETTAAAAAVGEKTADCKIRRSIARGPFESRLLRVYLAESAINRYFVRGRTLPKYGRFSTWLPAPHGSLTMSP